MNKKLERIQKIAVALTCIAALLGTLLLLTGIVSQAWVSGFELIFVGIFFGLNLGIDIAAKYGGEEKQ